MWCSPVPECCQGNIFHLWCNAAYQYVSMSFYLTGTVECHWWVHMIFQVLLGRLCLGSVASRRTVAAKDQHCPWVKRTVAAKDRHCPRVNRARSRCPNTSRREGTKAAWGATQTWPPSPRKDPRLVAQEATQPLRCCRRPSRNPRRRRELGLKSSNNKWQAAVPWVTLPWRRDANFPWTISSCFSSCMCPDSYCLFLDR